MKFFLLLSRLTWRKPQQDKSLLWNRKSIFILRILYDKCSNSVGGGRERRICRKCGSHRSRGVGLTVHLAPPPHWQVSLPLLMSLPPAPPPPPPAPSTSTERLHGTRSNTFWQVNQKEKKESNFVNNRPKKIKMLGYMHFVAKLF